MIMGSHLSPVVLITRLHILNHGQRFIAGDGLFASSPSLLRENFVLGCHTSLLYHGIACLVFETFNFVSCEEKMVNLDI